ncbi:MAG: cytochrome c oxidase assembly protein [Betaproteobacteria bacterium HGW-Betaproteobacteria-7]|jgi:cytochrome c oxidase assembly protein subunit 11|nr:MAG: cytochrome c oxidase assembly protein [Betaproteobacteria bacterium HGW-Betaproteobacteria-7]
MEQVQPTPRNHSRLVVKLLLLVAGAFLFAFALVPLYNVLCEVTGFNGKTSAGFASGGLKTELAPAPASRVDTGRLIRIEFTGTVMPGLPWEMRPLKVSMDVHPGELQQISYLVRNTANRAITGQAVPSVTPGQAAQHFEKIECFCFDQQTLAAGEAQEMPLAFIVSPEVGRDITHITLSYAFFSIEGQRQTLSATAEAR